MFIPHDGYLALLDSVNVKVGRRESLINNTIMHTGIIGVMGLHRTPVDICTEVHYIRSFHWSSLELQKEDVYTQYYSTHLNA
jgi:hypothetical protein